MDVYWAEILMLFLVLTTVILNSLAIETKFRFNSGIPQGGVLSSLLFNIIMLSLFHLIASLNFKFIMDKVILDPLVS